MSQLLKLTAHSTDSIDLNLFQPPREGTLLITIPSRNDEHFPMHGPRYKSDTLGLEEWD